MHLRLNRKDLKQSLWTFSISFLHSNLLHSSKECNPPSQTQLHTHTHHITLLSLALPFFVHLLILGVSALPEIRCNTEHNTKIAGMAVIVNRPNFPYLRFLCVDKIASSLSDLSHEYCKSNCTLCEIAKSHL